MYIFLFPEVLPFLYVSGCFIPLWWLIPLWSGSFSTAIFSLNCTYLFECVSTHAQATLGHTCEVCLCVRVCSCCMGMYRPGCICGGQRITYGSQFPPFTMWIPWDEIRLSGLVASIFTSSAISLGQSSISYNPNHQWRMFILQSLCEMNLYGQVRMNFIAV